MTERFEQSLAETSADEMLRILATDFGIDPERIYGFAVVIATSEGGAAMRPAVRTSLGAGTTAYLLTAAAAEMQFLSLADPAHPDHGDICDGPDEHDQ